MEERVLAKKSDIVAIAESIRSRTGDTNKIALEEMPELIENIGDGVAPIYQTILEGLIFDKSVITNDHFNLFNNSTNYAPAAFCCWPITAVDFPNLTDIPSRCFYGCSELTTANFPQVTKISGSYIFENCSNLVSINFPLLEEVSGNYTFYGCSSLTTISFPRLTKLGGLAFYSNSKLSSIYLNAYNPGSITSSYNFGYCRALNTLVLRSEQMWTLNNTNAFTSTPIASGTGYIYVPSSVIETYKTAANWSTYANQFRALEDYTVDGTITGALDEAKIAA